MKQDRTKWPRCMLWHGWLPGLTARPTGSPWAVAASDLASHNLEKSLGPYPICTDSPWHPIWDQDDAQDMADSVPDQPNIWSDGRREPILHLDIEVAGAGAFAHLPSHIFDSNQWRDAQDLDGHSEGSCHIFVGVNGMLQTTVQRAEYWGVMLALQAFSGLHIWY